jgi:hypothetical protein
MKRIFIRPSDYEIFSENEDGSYSLEMMKRDFPGHLYSEYSAEVLRRIGFTEKEVTSEEFEEFFQNRLTSSNKYITTEL